MSNKKKPAGSVNVDAIKRETQKMSREAESRAGKKSFGTGSGMSLAPGSTKRESPREQEMGTGKYRQMIHDHNDKNKHVLDRLPFTFPRKKMIRSNQTLVLICERCGETNFGTEHTVGLVCVGCKKYTSVKNEFAELLGYDPELKVGIDGTASDRVNKKYK
jgi:hypothetical protein